MRARTGHPNACVASEVTTPLHQHLSNWRGPREEAKHTEHGNAKSEKSYWIATASGGSTCALFWTKQQTRGGGEVNDTSISNEEQEKATSHRLTSASSSASQLSSDDKGPIRTPSSLLIAGGDGTLHDGNENAMRAASTSSFEREGGGAEDTAPKAYFASDHSSTNTCLSLERVSEEEAHRIGGSVDVESSYEDGRRARGSHQYHNQAGATHELYNAIGRRRKSRDEDLPSVGNEIVPPFLIQTVAIRPGSKVHLERSLHPTSTPSAESMPLDDDENTAKEACMSSLERSVRGGVDEFSQACVAGGMIKLVYQYWSIARNSGEETPHTTGGDANVKSRRT